MANNNTPATPATVPNQLPPLPKKQDYEDYVAAILQTGGYFLERNMSYVTDVNLLELDIVATKLDKNNEEKTLVEIKSGDWGFNDIFKVRGWMEFLGIAKASFITLKHDPDIAKKQVASRHIGVNLISNDSYNTNEIVTAFGIPTGSLSTACQSCYRFAYEVEKELRWHLSDVARSNNPVWGGTAQRVAEYWKHVTDTTFFIHDPIDRIKELFDLFVSNKYITVTWAWEKANKQPWNADEPPEIPAQSFRQLFYESTQPDVLYSSLFAEHLNRLLILKCCVEELAKPAAQNWTIRLKRASLPSNLYEGLRELGKCPNYHLYPYLWQVFTYLFGGFILTDKQQDEHKLLSHITGVPESEIPMALHAFQMLFPHPDGDWLHKVNMSNIRAMHFFPLPFSGVGVHFRRSVYLSQQGSFNAILSGVHTVDDLNKWQNLTYQYLMLNRRAKHNNP